MGSDILTSLRPALVLTVLFALLLGLAYPLALTGVAQLAFPRQANGSLVRDDQGTVIGSTVVGQAFAAERYFQSRPSAAGKGYDGLASSGSNLGPTARPLVERVKADIEKRRAEGLAGPLPADLVTASASGLDPDLSPDAAFAQVPRVARTRGLAEPDVRALVERHIEPPTAGFLGEPRVNLLALNRQLDRLDATTGR